MLYFKKEIKCIGIGVLIADLIAVLFAVMLGKFSVPVIVGISFGSIFTMLKFFLLITATVKAVYYPPEKAKSYMTTHYFLRFALTAIVLAIAAKADYINFIATVIPMVSVRISLLFIPWLDKKTKKGE